MGSYYVRSEQKHNTLTFLIKSFITILFKCSVVIMRPFRDILLPGKYAPRSGRPRQVLWVKKIVRGGNRLFKVLRGPAGDTIRNYKNPQ